MKCFSHCGQIIKIENFNIFSVFDDFGAIFAHAHTLTSPRERNIREEILQNNLFNDSHPNGDIPIANGVVPISNRVVPISNGVVPKSNGVVPIANGDVPISNGVVPNSNGVVPIANVESKYIHYYIHFYNHFKLNRYGFR
jgi:hypothetical protein